MDRTTVEAQLYSLFSGSVTAITIAMVVLLVVLIILFIRTFAENWVLWLIIAITIIVMIVAANNIRKNATLVASTIGQNTLEQLGLIPDLPDNLLNNVLGVANNSNILGQRLY